MVEQPVIIRWLYLSPVGNVFHERRIRYRYAIVNALSENIAYRAGRELGAVGQLKGELLEEDEFLFDDYVVLLENKS